MNVQLYIGNHTGDATVNDICALRYKDDCMQYKLSHGSDWNVLPVRRTTRSNGDQLQPRLLYETQPKKAAEKF